MSPLNHGRRRGLLIVAAAALAAAGLALLFIGLRSQQHAPAPAADAARPSAEGIVAPAPSGSAKEPTIVGPVLSRSVPTSLSIPALKLNAARLAQYGLDDQGAVDIPQSKPGVPAGWFTGSPTPGQTGPAVIVGHVDSASGPSVFFKLGAMRPGQQVDVTRSDNTIATFTVDSVEEYHKAQFPTVRVYGNTDRAALRLITCGGPYNSSTGHYEDNVVVFAHLTGSRPA